MTRRSAARQRAGLISRRVEVQILAPRFNQCANPRLTMRARIAHDELSGAARRYDVPSQIAGDDGATHSESTSNARITLVARRRDCAHDSEAGAGPAAVQTFIQAEAI